ncbi:MAG: RluA family pseudouridine synthase, partial [Gemmatimonadetes bacterium]|nr:RluA family pseudouridine synthase [Gemmatimonadota bacterium]
MPLNQGYEYTERLPLACEGEPLLLYLARTYPHSTEAEWRERMEAGEVTLDGAPAGPETEPRAGQQLIWRRPPWEEPDAPLSYGVLHEDHHAVVVDKPAGLPTLPGAGFLENTLLARVRADFPEVSPVHRLGRWTSGTVLFARTADARTHFGRAWGTDQVLKSYRALLGGRPERDALRAEHPIGPVPHDTLGSVHAASDTGRASRSDFRIIERRADSSLADVVIRTGRPHQIRIHAAALGFPLLGDPLYISGGRPAAGCRALPG